MMASARLCLSDETLRSVQNHLFGGGLDREQGGFLLCSTQECEQGVTFTGMEWIPLMPEHYVQHDIDYLELRDEVRALLIKRAHDASAAMVELHSHPWSVPAHFSEPDVDGLAQFVPHVRWRLKRRPYGALVFGPDTYDGLAWLGNDPVAVALG